VPAFAMTAATSAASDLNSIVTSLSGFNPALLNRCDSVQTVADLKGKTIYTTGKGTTPEYTLRYLLSSAGLNPDSDVTIEFK